MKDKKSQDILLESLPKGTKPEHLLKKLHSVEGRFAQLITNFAGSMLFVYAHIAWFGAWIILNSPGLKHIFPPFDPFPYGLLTMIVSLEAIFLSTFIMINQNRQALVDTYRELEEEQDELAEEQQHEELEEDVEDIQKNLDDIKDAMVFIQQKISVLEHSPVAGGTGHSPKE